MIWLQAIEHEFLTSTPVRETCGGKGQPERDFAVSAYYNVFETFIYICHILTITFLNLIFTITEFTGYMSTASVHSVVNSNLPKSTCLGEREKSFMLE